MFKSRKKNNITGPGAVDRAQKGKDTIAAEAALYGKDLVAHVMPERFRSVKLSSKKAKKAGILVLFFGTLFLISAVIIVYNYILKPRLGASPVTNNIPEAPAKEEQTKTPAPATEEEIPGKIAVNEAETPAQPVVIPSEEKPEIEMPAVIATTTAATATTTRQPATSTKTVVVKPPALEDLDQDGLSDKEEKLLGSNIKLADSDGDGYDDLSELVNLYNPAGEGKITESSVFASYTNSTYNYSFYYSLAWPIKKFGGDDSIMFEIDNVQFFQIIVQPNVDKKPISQWFIDQFGVDQYSPARMLNKNGWEGITKADGNIFYLTDKDREYLITLSYNLGIEEVEYYKNIFNLLVNTFTIND